MMQHELSPAPFSTKDRKRVGRGSGSGHGNYAGRGRKGQKSRRGHSIPRGFEGGQMPLIKRLPRKRGFVNVFRTEYTPVNLAQLSVFETSDEVTPEKLLSAGIIKSLKQPVKILADGDLSHPLTVRANKFSAAAKAKIEASGGKAEEIAHATTAD